MNKKFDEKIHLERAMKLLKKLEAGHKKRHVELHEALDELVADWTAHTKKLPSKTTIMSLIEWSYKETLNPTSSKE